MKPVHWIFLLCLVLCLGCDCCNGEGRIIELDHQATDASVFCDTRQTLPPLRFADNVLVYLNENTTVDQNAFAASGQTKTTLTDSHGLVWELNTRHGIKSQNLVDNGFTENWFLSPRANYQRYFYKIFQGLSAPAEDPMVDGPAMCILLLDAGSGWYLWLRRNADLVACPTVIDCDNWLPSAILSQP